MEKPAIHGDLLPMYDAEVVFQRDFFGQAEAETFFTRLMAEVNWQPQEVKIFGKFVPVPRRVSWYGDAGTDYSELSHGSFLLMRGQTQHYWSHQLPKTTRQMGPRINLTYRVVYR